MITHWIPPLQLAVTGQIYWPFWLVCIGGVVLVIIAILALLLVKGHMDYPDGKKKPSPEMPPEEPKPAAQPPVENAPAARPPAASPTTLTFVRIGRLSREVSTPIVPQRWLTVGRAADFCLDGQDLNLADVHFRVRLTGETLWVEAVEKETFVNGVPTWQLGMIAMESGSLLRAGSYEYRVMLSLGKGSEHII